jgi:hypothetical protein
MPIKIIADYRELLIDIFFAIIIAVGFDGFVRDFLIDNIKEISSPSIILDIFFFFTAYFWVISHWVFYHELITKYPYYRWRKFFVDVALFSLMFVIANISYRADQYEFRLLLVGLLVIWYGLACAWHLSDRGLRPLRLYLGRHALRIITYTVLLFLLYDPVQINVIFPLYQSVVTAAVVLSMIVWNAHRLMMFTRKDSRFYHCNSASGYPGVDMPDGGELELIRYPIKKKLGIQGKDSIKFKSKYSEPIVIFAEDITELKIVPMSDRGHVCDLGLQIGYKSSAMKGTAREFKILIDVDDEIIESVSEGIKGLVKRYKHEPLLKSLLHL